MRNDFEMVLPARLGRSVGINHLLLRAQLFEGSLGRQVLTPRLLFVD